MALIKCKECGENISKKASSCPKCGAPAKKKTSVLAWLIVILLGLGFIGYLTGEQKKEVTKSKPVVTKEIDKYSGLSKAEKTKAIVKDLQSIPASEFKKIRDLYAALVKLNPEFESFKIKLEHYSKKTAELEAKQAAQSVKARAVTARKKSIERQFSSWDGSHRNLERIIKDAMNDPDSYDHVKTVYWDMDDYLVVMTTYRGKNAFGGIVKNFVKAKVSLKGEILSIIDES